MGRTRWVTIGFVTFGVLGAIVLAKMLGAVTATFKLPDYALLGPTMTLSTLLAWVVALGMTVHYYRDEKWRTLGTEIVQEISKVVWPTWDETKQATVVVVITTIIIALILYFFDMIWSGITSWIYT